MALLRLLSLLLVLVALGCDGDRCDEDEQCFSNSCDYGQCGSTIVNIIARAIEDETRADDAWSYDDTPEDFEAPRLRPECGPWSCLYLDEENCERSGCHATFVGCGEPTDFACALAGPECSPECPRRIVCGGTPTICDDLDRGECLAEPACSAPAW
jgi:hypothetical protein